MRKVWCIAFQVNDLTVFRKRCGPSLEMLDITFCLSIHSTEYTACTYTFFSTVPSYKKKMVALVSFSRLQ